jgi:hypothetical protein
MKKFFFLLGFGAGLVCGSKAGPGPYTEVESRLLALTRRPEVQRAVENTKTQVSDMIERVVDKLPGAWASAA